MFQKSKIASAVAAITLSLATTASVSAFPYNQPAGFSANDGAKLIQVQHKGPDCRPGDRKCGFHERGGKGYYNGHQGSRHKKPGYRQQNGWWFPPAAFALGAVMGGVIAQQHNGPAPARVRGNLPPQHYRWCQNHYRSYRASDNTYNPYHGPRRACRSPYWR